MELLDQVSMAFLVVLQRLTPAERAVLLLREVFEFDYKEIAALVEKSEPACRKLLERARQNVAAEKRLFSASPEAHRRLLEAFTRAARAGDLETLVGRQGINGFYDSRAARLACCTVRKVEPLERALAGARGWIAGLRAEQSAHRQDMALVTAEAERGLIKLNPLFDWTREQLMAFVSENDLPINPLHAQGFASIGCAPCTRAIAPGEPERAGRWWWEEESKKECGLHSHHP